MPRPAFTPDVTSRYTLVMGEPLAHLYVALMEDLLWLHDKWAQFLKLYGHSPEREVVLNAVAPYFFALVEEVMWQDIVLHIARLTDPAETFAKSKNPKPNLSLLALPPSIADPTCSADLQVLVSVLDKKVAFARDWRNRQLAHTDRALALRQAAVTPLAPVNRQAIDEALATMRDMMNTVEGHFCNATMEYETAPTWDADSLMLRLGAG